jgi:hypothetical protein
MSRYGKSPLTHDEAKREMKKLEDKRIADAQRKSEAYSRLVGNADFKLFMEEVCRLKGDNFPFVPTSEFYQGRTAFYNEIVAELNYAHGAAKLIASFTERQLDELHKTKVFRVEQKGK